MNLPVPHPERRRTVTRFTAPKGSELLSAYLEAFVGGGEIKWWVMGTEYVGVIQAATWLDDGAAAFDLEVVRQRQVDWSTPERAGGGS